MKYGAIRELPLQILKINKGKGKKTYADGEIAEGIWNDGKLISQK